ncbi:MAG TPA: hydroxyisourate hydrolase [Vineibacter sp.]|nr:hydroxyisourate hydrolase [Vineibacter sp.]
MAGGISIHIVDVSRGVPAAGMRVELVRLEAGGPVTIASGAVNAGGLLPLSSQIAATPQAVGLYEAVFHVGPFYRARGEALPTPAFVEQATFRFGIAEPTQHYHLPMKVTPWGYSLFRGGA